MTTYYLSSVDGDNGSDGTSWANAWATFEYAVETASAVAAGPHTLLVDSAHSEALGGDTTVTLAGVLFVISVNRAGGDVPLAGAEINNGATNYNLIINGAFAAYFYGLTLRNGASTGERNITLASSDGSHFEFESCKFTITSTSGTPGVIVGSASAAINTYVKFKSCVWKHSNAAQRVVTGYSGNIDFVDCSIDATGTVITSKAFHLYNTGPGVNMFFTGCDWSHVGANTLISSISDRGVSNFVFSNCKLNSGSLVAAQATVLNKGGINVWAFNCNSGDAHYSMYHMDNFGETTISNTVYVTADGAAYDGTNRCSWKIVTTANCNYYYPYVSPWIDVYHSGTSAITPYLEILRSGSTTKYQNDEVWSEWSYQGTSGSTKATLVNDRMTPLGTAADQTASSLGASDWTGEDATNNAYMKLESGSITPAEIGHIRARVVMGEPNITVYVDPYIRGLT